MAPVSGFDKGPGVDNVAVEEGLPPVEEGVGQKSSAASIFFFEGGALDFNSVIANFGIVQVIFGLLDAIVVADLLAGDISSEFRRNKFNLGRNLPF